MWIEFMLFGSTFLTVFALGLQTQNVAGRHYFAAGITSFLIGSAQLVLFKTLPGDTTASQLIAYLLGGPLGIVAAMWLHPVMVRRGRKKHFVGKFNIDCGADGL